MFLIRLAKRLLRLARYNSFMWSGDYPDWPSAMRRCTGYEADDILDRCRAALREVMAGRAAYERDSLLFHDDRYCWELMTVAYQTALRNGGRLSVLDFGGALGSLYFQHKKWLADIPSVAWHVVEQPHFVDCGRAEAEDGRLRFFHTIEESMAASRPDVLLLSGVLQALERPYEWAERFNNLDVPYIVLDRVAIVKDLGRDVLTVQKVAPHIYPASYPSWFFNEARFLEAFSNYLLISAFQSQYDWNQWVGGRRCTWKGYILRRKAVDAQIFPDQFS
jgi:putative methyltransferase (TIGR04325 family)